MASTGPTSVEDFVNDAADTTSAPVENPVSNSSPPTGSAGGGAGPSQASTSQRTLVVQKR